MTMLVVKVPLCQESVQVVAEYDLETDSWVVTAPNVVATGKARNFDQAIAKFAIAFNNFFKD